MSPAFSCPLCGSGIVDDPGRPSRAPSSACRAGTGLSEGRTHRAPICPTCAARGDHWVRSRDGLTHVEKPFDDEWVATTCACCGLHVVVRRERRRGPSVCSSRCGAELATTATTATRTLVVS